MPSVLLIEDNAPFRAILAEVLMRAGYEVFQASDGRRGVQLLLERPVNLVITDLVMPDQDGIETIRRLRESHPQLPVIAMSGDAPRNVELYLGLAGKLGAARILRKPFSVAALAAAVREILEPPTAWRPAPPFP